MGLAPSRSNHFPWCLVKSRNTALLSGAQAGTSGTISSVFQSSSLRLSLRIWESQGVECREGSPLSTTRLQQCWNPQLLFCFVTDFCYVAQAGLELKILLPQLPESWDDKPVLPQPAFDRLEWTEWTREQRNDFLQKLISGIIDLETTQSFY